MSSYVPECYDGSDVFVCPTEACENHTQFFQCKDGKYCIFAILVCDGYAQCEDESGKQLSVTKINLHIPVEHFWI